MAWNLDAPDDVHSVLPKGCHPQVDRQFFSGTFGGSPAGHVTLGCIAFTCRLFFGLFLFLFIYFFSALSHWLSLCFIPVVNGRSSNDLPSMIVEAVKLQKFNLGGE